MDAPHNTAGTDGSSVDEPLSNDAQDVRNDVADSAVAGSSDPVRYHVGREGSRREARTKALEVLYAADLRDRSVEELLAEGVRDPFTVTLVSTFAEHRRDIDRVINDHAVNWSVGRMALVDRNVLRIGVIELLHVPSVPWKVAIDEAVELAKAFSGDNAPKFINGVLASVHATQHDEEEPSSLNPLTEDE